MNFYKTIFYLILCTFLISCSIIKRDKLNDFTVKDAYYQSWVHNEDRGINIIITLINYPSNLNVQSIVFRDNEIPLSQTKKNNKLIIKGTYTPDDSRLKNKAKPSKVKDETLLIYELDKIKKSYILKRVRREKTKYY